jgi:hypothetical protein
MRSSTTKNMFSPAMLEISCLYFSKLLAEINSHFDYNKTL